MKYWDIASLQWQHILSNKSHGPCVCSLAWFNINPRMAKWWHLFQSSWWNFMSIPKLQLCSQLILEWMNNFKSYWCYDGSNDSYLVHIKEPIGHVTNDLQINCFQNTRKDKTELHRGYPTRCAHKKAIQCLFPGSQRKSGNKQENSQRVSAKSFRRDSTYIIRFLTWWTHKGWLKRRFSHIDIVLHIVT